MNKRQLTTLWIGLGIITIMVLFPPWKYVFWDPNRLVLEKPGPYASIFSSPEIPITSKGVSGDGFFQELPCKFWSVKIDIPRLIFPIVTVLIVTGGLIFTFGRLPLNKNNP